MRLPGCHSACVLPGILTTPRVQQAWLEAPRVSFHTCFTGDVEHPDVQKAWLEPPRVSFHTCFTEDSDKTNGNVDTLTKQPRAETHAKYGTECNFCSPAWDAKKEVYEVCVHFRAVFLR